MQKIISAVLACAIFMLASGCASYRATGGFPSKDLASYQLKQEHNGVSMAAKFYDKKETYRMFQRYLLGRGVQPVFIIIENKSGSVYKFRKDECSKQIITGNEVADRCRFSGGARTFWYYLGSCFTFGLLLIPAVVDGMGSAEANDMMRKDYVNKEFDYSADILPNTTVAGFIYSDKVSAGENFTVKLENAETKEMLAFSFQMP